MSAREADCLLVIKAICEIYKCCNLELQRHSPIGPLWFAHLYGMCFTARFVLCVRVLDQRQSSLSDHFRPHGNQWRMRETRSDLTTHAVVTLQVLLLTPAQGTEIRKSAIHRLLRRDRTLKDLSTLGGCVRGARGENLACTNAPTSLCASWKLPAEAKKFAIVLHFETSKNRET